jgi:hypothetical protein
MSISKDGASVSMVKSKTILIALRNPSLPSPIWIFIGGIGGVGGSGRVGLVAPKLIPSKKCITKKITIATKESFFIKFSVFILAIHNFTNVGDLFKNYLDIELSCID